jgi:hypothetical protein
LGSQEREERREGWRMRECREMRFQEDQGAVSSYLTKRQERGGER